MPNTERTVLRFDDFEIDLEAALLRKRGVRVRLPGQSFQVLVSLLEHPGRVVTRAELQRRLWPDDVFVDFENSLNSAIGRLREALNDSAERPRFVETLSRRGYRFIAAPAGETMRAGPPGELPDETELAKLARRFARAPRSRNQRQEQQPCTHPSMHPRTSSESNRARSTPGRGACFWPIDGRPVGGGHIAV